MFRTAAVKKPPVSATRHHSRGPRHRAGQALSRVSLTVLLLTILLGAPAAAEDPRGLDELQRAAERGIGCGQPGRTEGMDNTVRRSSGGLRRCG